MGSEFDRPGKSFGIRPIFEKASIKICFSTYLSEFNLYTVFNIREDNDLIICRNDEKRRMRAKGAFNGYGEVTLITQAR